MLKRIAELERHQLSCGGVARVTKLGRQYGFMKSSPDADTPPYCVHGITKDEAYSILADTLAADVLELD